MSTIAFKKDSEASYSRYFLHLQVAIVCCGRHRLSSVGFADDTVPIYMSTDYRRFTLVGRGPTSASTGGRVSRIYKSCSKLLRNTIMNDMIYCFGKFAGISDTFHFITEKLKVEKRCSLV